MSPPWGSILFPLALHTYAPWGCIVRVVRLTKPRKIPTLKQITAPFGGQALVRPLRSGYRSRGRVDVFEECAVGGLAAVRAPSRSISPTWRPIRFRLAHHTYAPWGCIVRVVSQTKSRQIPTRNMLPLFVKVNLAAAAGPAPRAVGPCARSGGLEVHVRGRRLWLAQTAVMIFGRVFFVISFGSPHVRPTGHTCREPHEPELPAAH